MREICKASGTIRPLCATACEPGFAGKSRFPKHQQEGVDDYRVMARAMAMTRRASCHRW